MATVTVYLRVYTVEAGLALRVLWSPSTARTYFKQRKGREFRKKAPDGNLVVVFQTHWQHEDDPLGTEILEETFERYVSGNYVTTWTDMRSTTPSNKITIKIQGRPVTRPPTA